MAKCHSNKFSYFKNATGWEGSHVHGVSIDSHAPSIHAKPRPSRLPSPHLERFGPEFTSAMLLHLFDFLEDALHGWILQVVRRCGRRHRRKTRRDGSRRSETPRRTRSELGEKHRGVGQGVSSPNRWRLEIHGGWRVPWAPKGKLRVPRRGARDARNRVVVRRKSVHGSPAREMRFQRIDEGIAFLGQVEGTPR